MLFDDPLGVEFNETTQRIKEETMALLENTVKTRKKVAVPTQRFYMSSELRARLKELLKRQFEENVVTKICKQLLSLRTVPIDSINYLGLSNDDFSKISYLTPERYERVQGKTFVEKHVNLRTKVVINTEIEENFFVEGGQTEKRTRPKQYLGFFQKREIEQDGNKTIRLDRIKTYNPEESSKQGTSVFDVSYRLPQDGRTYKLSPAYGLRIENGDRLVDDLGRTILDWFLIDLGEKVVDSVWDYTLRYHQSIHKILSKIFKDEFTEREKNVFSEQYFKLVIPNKKGLEFKIATGEEIKHYYLESNYFRPANSSTLWQSCMRYPSTQKYLDFYLKIPGIKLAVLKENGQVIARSLLWYSNEKIYYDRIYYYNDEALAFMENYLDSTGFISMRDSHSAGVNARIKVDIKLPLSTFEEADYYPYLDSLRFYYPEREVLSNHLNREEDRYTLERTDGSYDTYPEHEDDEEYCCDECGSYSSDPDFVTEVERGPNRGSYACENCGILSEEYGDVILRSAAFYCDFSQSYVLDDDIVELHTGDNCYAGHRHLNQYENDFGYFLLEEHDYVLVNHLYYHPDDPVVAENEDEEELQENTNPI
jgi:hypothetical protein